MSYILFKNLSKSFLHNSEKLQVLKNLNLEVRRGEFLVIFGPNGCGKTTLLNIIAGLEKQDEGKLTIEGKSLENKKVGFVFQNYNESLLPWRSVKDNVALSLEANNTENKNEIERKATHFLKEVDLEKFAEKYPYQLSGGMKQLVSIARAFAYEPDFFLMDEPFSALDYDNRIKMEDKLLKLWSEHKKTVIFVSHDIEEAVYLADRIVVLAKRPTKVKEIINVRLKRPRNMEIRFSKEFFKTKNEVLKVFRREI